MKAQNGSIMLKIGLAQQSLIRRAKFGNLREVGGGGQTKPLLNFFLKLGQGGGGSEVGQIWTFFIYILQF